MDDSECVTNARTSVNKAGFRFVITELDTGLMFCSMASNSVGDPDARSLILACHSYEAALYHVKSLVLNALEIKLFDEKKAQLRSLLLTLGFAY